MSSLVKLAFPLITAALLGLSLPADVAFAQSVTTPNTIPPPLLCGKPSLLFSVMHGVDDNFSNTPPADSLPQPSSVLSAQYPLAAASNIFDQTASNYHFGDTFAINVPQNSTIVSARLVTRMKPLSGQPDNDGISLHVPGTPFNTSLGFSPSTITGNNWFPGNPSKIFVFNLATNFFTSMTAAVAAIAPQPVLDVYLQDDTSIDFLRLDVCYIPPKGIDVAAQKLRHGSTYVLNVSNPGGPIPSGDVVEVTDYIPIGVTVTAINAPSPWTCSASPPPLPVTGPAVVTCSYPITTPIITGGNLPPVYLMTTGTSKCPNCMRVRLLQPGAVPPQDTNMANNLSCVK